MSNELTLADTKVPAHISARIGQESKLGTAISGGLSSGAVPRISIKGGRFRVVEDGNEMVLQSLELPVVIVGANPRLSKLYYGKQWTPDQEPANPDCFSLDGVTPDFAATSPQNAQCVDCPHNAWGSRTTPQGTQVKACTDTKRLAVVAFEDVEGPTYLLQIPPASLRNLNAYHKELSHRSIPPEVVATRVSFDTSASHPKLLFGFGGFLTEEQQAVVDKLFGTDAILEITGEKTVPIPTTVPGEQAPAVNTTAPASAKKPVKVNKDVPKPPKAPEAPAPEAPKKRGFGGAAPAIVVPQPATAAPASNAATLPEDGELTQLEKDITSMIEGKPDDAAQQ